MIMKSYKICLEIELDAEDPLDAAEILEDWMSNNPRFQYYIQDIEDDTLYSVDLSEPEEDAVIQIKDYQPLIEI